jgi:hypothetical protein
VAPSGIYLEIKCRQRQNILNKTVKNSDSEQSKGGKWWYVGMFLEINP